SFEGAAKGADRRPARAQDDGVEGVGHGHHSKVCSLSGTMSLASVAALTLSRVVFAAISRSTSPAGVTSITASSVTIMFTTFKPVNGNEQRFTILCPPSLVVCSIATMTRLAPATRSIAPPIPLTILPGIIQLARLPS